MRRPEPRAGLDLERSQVRALPEKQPGWSAPLPWGWGPASSSYLLPGPQALGRGPRGPSRGPKGQGYLFSPTCSIWL